MVELVLKRRETTSPAAVGIRREYMRNKPRTFLRERHTISEARTASPRQPEHDLITWHPHGQAWRGKLDVSQGFISLNRICTVTGWLPGPEISICRTGWSLCRRVVSPNDAADASRAVSADNVTVAFWKTLLILFASVAQSPSLFWIVQREWIHR